MEHFVGRFSAQSKIKLKNSVEILQVTNASF